MDKYILGGVIFFIILSILADRQRRNKESKEQDSAWQKLLDSNGWISEGGQPLEEVPTFLMNAGHSQKIRRVFSGTYADQDFTGIVYEWEAGFSNDRRIYKSISMHFLLDQNFPFIVLNRLFETWFSNTDVPDRLPGTRRLQLEGNFNKDFVVMVLNISLRSIDSSFGA